MLHEAPNFHLESSPKAKPDIVTPTFTEEEQLRSTEFLSKLTRQEKKILGILLDKAPGVANLEGTGAYVQSVISIREKLLELSLQNQVSIYRIFGHTSLYVLLNTLKKDTVVRLSLHELPTLLHPVPEILEFLELGVVNDERIKPILSFLKRNILIKAMSQKGGRVRFKDLSSVFEVSDFGTYPETELANNIRVVVSIINKKLRTFGYPAFLINRSGKLCLPNSFQDKIPEGSMQFELPPELEEKKSLFPEWLLVCFFGKNNFAEHNFGIALRETLTRVLEAYPSYVPSEERDGVINGRLVLIKNRLQELKNGDKVRIVSYEGVGFFLDYEKEHPDETRLLLKPKEVELLKRHFSTHFLLFCFSAFSDKKNKYFDGGQFKALFKLMMAYPASVPAEQLALNIVTARTVIATLRRKLEVFQGEDMINIISDRQGNYFIEKN